MKPPIPKPVETEEQKAERLKAEKEAEAKADEEAAKLISEEEVETKKQAARDAKSKLQKIKRRPRRLPLNKRRIGQRLRPVKKRSQWQKREGRRRR